MIIYSPCKGCNERYLGCHSDCDKYKTYKSKVNAQTKARLKAKHKTYVGGLKNAERQLRTSQSNRKEE